jgi:2-succinyl-5-enolpyruvyl-6-hydroxy-3-cyclohexene-1-carboxylate synthase
MLSEQPFSGLSWTRCVAEAPIDRLLKSYVPSKTFGSIRAKYWLNEENEFHEKLLELFEEEKNAEPSLIHSLSKQIPQDANIYLGNSLPIREWDMAAIRENRNWAPNANRGVNGIDGQLSTFLGMCKKNCANWGIFGDLTTLYDMAGLWILPQLKNTPVKIVVINNGGGKIFERLYPYKEMLNEHHLSFGPLAEMWSLNYTCLNSDNNFQNSSENSSHQLIEIVPDEAATARFWSRYAKIDETKSAMTYASPV